MCVIRIIWSDVKYWHWHGTVMIVSIRSGQAVVICTGGNNCGSAERWWCIFNHRHGSLNSTVLSISSKWSHQQHENHYNCSHFIYTILCTRKVYTIFLTSQWISMHAQLHGTRKLNTVDCTHLLYILVYLICAAAIIIQHVFTNNCNHDTLFWREMSLSNASIAPNCIHNSSNKKNGLPVKLPATYFNVNTY